MRPSARRLLLLCLGLSFVALGEEPRKPVVVELFTSEGCSSCPAADALLLDLERTQPIAGVEIVPLSLHVTYWDNLRWADPFGDPAHADRQQRYAAALGGGTYTPEMVVDGEVAFPGGRERALAAIRAAAAAPKTLVAVRAVRVTPDAVEAEVTVSDPAGAGEADLVVALTQSNLRSHVKHGENQGRLLTHSAVVRSLRTSPVAAKTTVRFPRRAKWSAEDLRLVAFVQARSQRRVLGSAQAPVAVGTHDARAPER